MGTAQIAYLGEAEFDNGAAIRCGALVIKETGAPVEFRATSPVRPTVLQKIFYGRNLDAEVLVEVLGKPLVNELRESFDLVVVNNPLLLNLRRFTEKPVIYLRRQGDLTIGSPNHQASGLIGDGQDRFAPVVYETFTGNQEDVRSGKAILELAAENMDPLEPFERVNLALRHVHESKEFD